MLGIDERRLARRGINNFNIVIVRSNLTRLPEELALKTIFSLRSFWIVSFLEPVSSLS